MAGWALIVTLDAVEIHPDAFLAVMLYVPFDNPAKTPVVLVYVIPSILKLSPVLLEVTFIVPVETLQVGWDEDKVGVAGVAG